MEGHTYSEKWISRQSQAGAPPPDDRSVAVALAAQAALRSQFALPGPIEGMMGRPTLDPPPLEEDSFPHAGIQKASLQVAHDSMGGGAAFQPSATGDGSCQPFDLEAASMMSSRAADMEPPSLVKTLVQLFDYGEGLPERVHFSEGGSLQLFEPYYERPVAISSAEEIRHPPDLEPPLLAASLDSASPTQHSSVDNKDDIRLSPPPSEALALWGLSRSRSTHQSGGGPPQASHEATVLPPLQPDVSPVVPSSNSRFIGANGDSNCWLSLSPGKSTSKLTPAAPPVSTKFDATMHQSPSLDTPGSAATSHFAITKFSVASILSPHQGGGVQASGSETQQHEDSERKSEAAKPTTSFFNILKHSNY